MYIDKQFLLRPGPTIIDISVSQLQSLLQGDMASGQNSVQSLAGRVSPWLALGFGFFLQHGISGEILVLETIVSIV